MTFWSPEDTLRRRKYLHYFACLDTNHNGVLEWSDFSTRAQTLAELLRMEDDERAVGLLLDAERVFWSSMHSQMDQNQDGTIDREEFVGFYSQLGDEIAQGAPIPAWALAPLRAMLELVDHNDDGLIDADEFTLFIWSLNSNADATEAFKHLDLNGDGTIDLDELEILYREWITSDDADAPGNYLLTGRLPPWP